VCPIETGIVSGQDLREAAHKQDEYLRLQIDTKIDTIPKVSHLDEKKELSLDG